MTSVKQKIAGIQKEREEIQSAVKRMHGSIREQEKINAAAIYQIGVGIKKVQSGIAQTSREVQAAVNKLQGAIRNQANENKAYIKDFYFGEGKTEGKK